DPWRDPRPHGGATMISPTPRAVLLFSGGIAPALFLIIFDTRLWPWSLAYGIAALVAIAVDAALAFPYRALRVTSAGPDSLQSGEGGALTVPIAPTPYQRTTEFEILCELRGSADPPAIATATVVPGREAGVSIPLVPRQRGLLFVDAMWL